MNKQELRLIIDEYLEKYVYPLEGKEKISLFSTSTKNSVPVETMANVMPQRDEEIVLCDYACPIIDDSIELDESFSEKLLRLIDEKEMKDTDCYKKANIDRKLFSKIRSDVHYRPSKETALALCIALRLPYEEIEDMLYKAGYALSDSSVFDVIVKLCLKNDFYDLEAIDQILYDHDQKTICRY